MANEHGLSNSLKAICTVLLLLMFGGWAVALGGLASMTNMCRTKHDDWNDAVTSRANIGASNIQNPIYEFDANTLSNGSSYNCGIQTSLWWWIIALQFVTLCLCLAGIFWATFHARSAVTFFLAIVTTLWCLFAYYTLVPAYRYQADYDDDNRMGQAFKTMFAGAVAVLVANFLFGLLYGQDQDDHRHYEPKPVVVTA